MIELLIAVLSTAVLAGLLLGYPVAFTLPVISVYIGFIAAAFGYFDITILQAIPNRVFGIMTNTTLIAVPLFISMGIILEQANIAENLLKTLAKSFHAIPGSMGVSVIAVGALLAASTGIIGATVVTLTIFSLPSLLEQGYSKPLATGTILATGTLGQIIPPAISLVILGDVLSNAFQEAQLLNGIFSPKVVSVADLFAGAIIPGLLLTFSYMVYFVLRTYFSKNIKIKKPKKNQNTQLLRNLVSPLALIIIVLGSIFIGIATPTEAGALGALGAIILAIPNIGFDKKVWQEIFLKSLITSVMVFYILIGATIFSLIFRSLGGDEAIRNLLMSLPGDGLLAMFMVMVFIFILGFLLDFIEISFVVIPIIAPILLMMGFDPIWLGIMFAINLQTSFLTPPFGFAIFYMQGAAPELASKSIYRGVIPFVGIQLLILLLIGLFPSLVTWLPNLIYA